MPARRQKHTMWVEQLFIQGNGPEEISKITGMRKDVVAGIIYRARQNGRLPQPVYTQAYDNRRNSYIRRGSIAQVLERLTPEQHKQLTETALSIGCSSLADLIAAHLVDGLCDEMGQDRNSSNTLYKEVAERLEELRKDVADKEKALFDTQVLMKSCKLILESAGSSEPSDVIEIIKLAITNTENKLVKILAEVRE